MNQKIICYLLLVYFLCANCFSNITKEEIDGNCKHYFEKSLNKNIYSKVDTLPVFLTGDQGFIKEFMKNYKYPPQETYQSKVLVEFIIDENGSIISSGIIDKDREQYTRVEIETLKTLKKLQKWIPGKCGDQKVAVKVTKAISIHK